MLRSLIFYETVGGNSSTKNLKNKCYVILNVKYYRKTVPSTICKVIPIKRDSLKDYWKQQTICCSIKKKNEKSEEANSNNSVTTSVITIFVKIVLSLFANTF